MSSVALQSKDHRDLLDAIDRLRSKGISQYVDLPEIIVCGDQSAGKSSVLEAISGMSFPTKDNLCTRFPTELVLRRHATTVAKVSINPGPERTADEKARLSRFQMEIDVASPQLGSVVEKAKEAMGLSETKVFSTDTLRVELCGPAQPHLTMVDLPGLYRAGNGDQSVSDAATVREMVCGYMKRPRSIILAVVSAKSDFALQEVTELARELDPKGLRTLGLITKPDTLDAGSDGEAAYLKLAQNKDVVFRLGWHVLKNRSYEMKDASSAERDEAEENFFATGIWTTMDASHLGVKSLKPHLSNVLKDQILLQLPDLLQDVVSSIADCQSRLKRFGTARASFEEQRRYLLRVAQDFSMLMKAATDGIYDDPFFGSAKSEAGYRKRLRAVTQNALADFRTDMSVDGKTRIIIDTSSDEQALGKGLVSRSDYINGVKDTMRRSRGCELPGTCNPLIIGELFTEQCQPWRNIAMRSKDAILQAVYRTTHDIIDHVAVGETAASIFQIVGAGIDALTSDLNDEMAELLEPHYDGRPITFNQYLTDNVQKAQSDRRRRSFEKTLKEVFGSDLQQKHQIVPLKLLTQLERAVEVDMERYAGDLAVDYMQAYCKVALKKFVGDVSVLALEHCLVRKLPSLLNTEMVYNLKEEEVARLAAETEENALERVRYVEKLAVLEDCLLELKRLDQRSFAPPDTHDGYGETTTNGRSHDDEPHKENSIPTPSEDMLNMPTRSPAEIESPASLEVSIAEDPDMALLYPPGTVQVSHRRRR